jgi:hypothetical protein
MLTWQQIIAAYMPALVILATVLLAAASYNRGLEQVGKRIDDLRNDTNKRIDDTNKRIDELGEASLEAGWRRNCETRRYGRTVALLVLP